MFLRVKKRKAFDRKIEDMVLRLTIILLSLFFCIQQTWMVSLISGLRFMWMSVIVGLIESIR